ncbi:hypothetical protein JMJ77_0001323 [Colletotrichum scovillei]|uniref:Uncharacterized protein n=1 Tax=Colletotrichum scovillei TaxID=1209932 RepID=A0A9P7RDN1_9PEZI|nr:hypothetical protein JMJ77_0001323 [Colletotrichum scovillei]KAG7072548.1 hypothetical protein JMJ76_0005397 [Colletotrichum scovillei]KAG7080803.1 hypothetical protein JMJ78_0007888 [Colletotrichum scovillei]
MQAWSVLAEIPATGPTTFGSRVFSCVDFWCWSCRRRAWSNERASIAWGRA